MAEQNPNPIEPYNLKSFAEGGTLELVTLGNVSIPVSINLLNKLVTVKAGDRQPDMTEKVMFANTIIEQKCNPYLNECWLVFMKGKYVPIIAAQKRIAKAQSLPSYDGYEWGWISKDGTRCPAGPENKVIQADIAGVWNRIYFKDRKVPFYHEIFLTEYSGRNNDRPITMLLKTARDQAHRFAFANEMGNLCTENEIYDERLPAPTCDTPTRDDRRKPVESKTIEKDVTATAEPVAKVVDTEIPIESTEIPSEATGEADEREMYAQLVMQFKEVSGLDDGEELRAKFIAFASFVLLMEEEELVSPEEYTPDMIEKLKTELETNGIPEDV